MITSPNRSSQAKSGDLLWKPVGLPICVNSPHPNIFVCSVVASQDQCPLCQAWSVRGGNPCLGELPVWKSKWRGMKRSCLCFTEWGYGKSCFTEREPTVTLWICGLLCNSTRRNVIPLGLNCGFCTLHLHAVVPQTGKCLSLNRSSPGRVSQRHAPAALHRLRRGERLQSPRPLLGAIAMYPLCREWMPSFPAQVLLLLYCFSLLF